MLEVVRVLDAEQFEPSAMALHEPTLDDVFLDLTGHRAEDPSADDDDETVVTPKTRGPRKRGRP